MSRRRLAILGAVVALPVAAALALPFLVDVDRYRPTIEAKLEEALGRDVRLGSLRLSIVPFGVRVQDLAIAGLPGEGGGDLVSASSLRVGARLLPLLSKRLEVTGIVIDRPLLTLERRPDGSWNVQRLVAPKPAASPAPPPEAASTASFTVDTVRLVNGEVTLRVPAAAGGHAELKLTEVELTLANVALDRVVDLKLEARPSIAPGGKLSLAGSVGPLQPAAGESLRLAATLQLEAIPPAALAKWGAAFGAPSVPAGLFGERPATLDVHLTAESVEGGGALRRIDVDRLRLADLDLVLARGRDGRWNYAPLLGGGGGDAAPRDAGPAFALAGLAIENARLRLQDQAAPGKPFDQTIERLDLTLDRLPTAGPARGELTLALAGTDIRIGGTVDSSGRRPKVDMTLHPTRISAAGLRSLLALAGSDVPLSFEAGEPIEIEARVTGEVGEGRTPDLNGKLTLKQFSFQHPSMKEPLREVNGTLTLAGQTIEIRGFQARMGESDLAGDVTVTGLRAPKVRFDLRSRRADFWALMSFVGGDAAADPAAADPGRPDAGRTGITPYIILSQTNDWHK